MGFATLATTAASVAANALPNVLQAYALNKQSKSYNSIAEEQERLSNRQADLMEDAAVANQQRAARNATAQLAMARADAAASGLAAEGSARTRELDLATRLQDEINNQTDAALDEADHTRKQGAVHAWHARNYAAQAKTRSITSIFQALNLSSTEK